MAKSPSVRIVMTQELDAALKAASDEEVRPAAVIVREALADYLKRKHKVKLTDIHPGWGGYRDGED